METERKANETAIVLLKTERKAIFEEQNANKELIRKTKGEIARLKTERQAHREAAQNAKAAQVDKPREALLAERKANELMCKAQGELARVKMEHAAHRKACGAFIGAFGGSCVVNEFVNFVNFAHRVRAGHSRVQKMAQSCKRAFECA